MISIGFTGTRRGMTDKQQSSVLTLLSRFTDASETHHGDCVGADTMFHRLSMLYNLKVVKHPPTDSTYRGFCQGGIELKPKPYLTRNKDIVKLSDIVIATPGQDEEILRSGTWATIRYAKRLKKKVYIIKLNGQIELI